MIKISFDDVILVKDAETRVHTDSWIQISLDAKRLLTINNS